MSTRKKAKVDTAQADVDAGDSGLGGADSFDTTLTTNHYLQLDNDNVLATDTYIVHCKSPWSIPCGTCTNYSGPS